MKKAAQIILLTGVFLLIGTSIVRAQTPTTTPTPTSSSSPDEGKLRGEISELENKISSLQTEQKSLNSQINIVDSQIELSELKIENTKSKISELNDDIDITKQKIGNIEGSMDVNTQALINRAVAIYQVGKVEPWEILATSDNVQDFLKRLTYLKIVQENDKKMLLAAQQAKVDYSNTQDILGEKVDKELELQDELQAYNDQLASDRKKKEELLAVTKNSEKEYQARLADALRELNQISSAAKILLTSEPKEVTRGEPIGLMGSTGYAFGAHLHFGIYNISKLEDYNYYSNNENPINVLESRSVNWLTECGGDPSGMNNSGGGSFAWPMETSGLYITQNYGITCYSGVYYGGRPHPALDMYNNSNVVVRAAEAGKAYVCRNCTGDGANGVFIFHNNGKMSLYWHLQ